MLPTTPEPQNTDTNRTYAIVGVTLLFVILTRNASLRRYCTFAYIPPSCTYLQYRYGFTMYITCAHGHELSRVFVHMHIIIIMPGCGLQIDF